MGKWGGLWIAAMLLAAPAVAHEKRADKCGCHHQYGLRHCHPKKKTDHCEAPVKATERARQQSAVDHGHDHDEDRAEPFEAPPRKVQL